MKTKSLFSGILLTLAIFVLAAGCENSAGISKEELNSAIEESRREFVNTDPQIETLDKALTYFSKWMVSSLDGVSGILLYQSVSFTSSLFSVDYLDFGELTEGKYAYKLAKDGDSWLLSVTDWLNYAPNDPAALKPAARLRYNPQTIEITFTNAEGSEYQVWGDEGTVFAPDMTPYYEAAGIKSQKWFYVDADDVPQIDIGKKAEISFNATSQIVTSDAAQVFPTAVNNKTNTYWGIIGKDRKLVIGTGGTDLGTVSLKPGKNLTIGGKKFAYGINPCTYICSYREVDCCPTINTTWSAVDGAEAELTGDNALYITVASGARNWKANNAKGGSDAVDSTVYGEGLAGITANNGIIWVSGSKTAMLYSSEGKPLFELVDVSKLLTVKEMTIKPAAAGASNITLKIAQ